MLCLLGLGSWMVSVVLEWPFCVVDICAPTGRCQATESWRTSLRASVVAQTASYALLVPFYLLVSPISLYTQSRIHSTPWLSSNPPRRWCITSTLRTVASGAFARMAQERKKVLDAHVQDENARLFLRPNVKSGLSDLGMVEQDKQHRQPSEVHDEVHDALEWRGIRRRAPVRCAEGPRARHLGQLRAAR